MLRESKVRMGGGVSTLIILSNPHHNLVVSWSSEETEAQGC